MSGYPINSSELCRRLLGREIVSGDDRAFVYGVRGLLGKFGCPKAGDSQQAWWVIDEAMEKRVATKLGLPLR